MPLGIERLNVRKQQPNSRIVFIKPLEGPHKAHAQDFLERIAAICHPIMKAHHLAVMSLEEYEPNREFVGRNFNAGEVIQLVLRAPYSGHWLPFRHVQMVMMHELAHCKEMNHGRGFWAVRDGYAAELRALWAKDYTGDGFWSRGQPLLSSEYTTTSLAADDPTPDSLCGGIYRTASSGRKRKRGKPKNVAAARPALTYAERQQRRIARKFGTNGVALGEDQTARVAWHKGKKVKGKPRVAGSARGRELRAAAALARFQPVETDVKGQGEEENDEFDDDDENDSDEYGEGEGEEGMTEKGTKGLDEGW
ncbi:MAG: hypothetical protein M1838_002077 [Thelocarpon superellum]|nr:MAG: hypothetical protein M1838_002077 [Thelocarpon superellum]